MKNKRFIAGAHCPKCSEQDKVYTYELEGKKFRACTRCDFNEEMRFETHKQELQTRVNRVEPAKTGKPADETAQVLKFHQPDKN